MLEGEGYCKLCMVNTIHDTPPTSQIVFSSHQDPGSSITVSHDLRVLSYSPALTSHHSTPSHHTTPHPHITPLHTLTSQYSYSHSHFICVFIHCPIGFCPLKVQPIYQFHHVSSFTLPSHHPKVCPSVATSVSPHNTQYTLKCVLLSEHPIYLKVCPHITTPNIL